MMTHTKYDHIEPGMLTLFRLAYIIWLLVVITGWIVWFFSWGDVPFLDRVSGSVNVVLLLAYLFSGRLQRRLGRWYLPLGLLVASVGAVTVAALHSAWAIYIDVSPEQLTGWAFMPQLLILVVIVSVQYGFRGALIYVMSMAALQAAVMFTVVSYAIPSAFMTSVNNVLPVRLVTTASPFDIVTVMIVFELIGFPIIAVAVVGLTGGQKKERRALTAKNIKLTQYATTIERLAISQERNRLARELHDTLAHTLSAVSVQVEALKKQLERDPNSPTSAKETVKQLRELTRNGMKESRGALKALRASPLEDMGLILAMQQLVDAMSDRSGMTITLALLGDIDDLQPEVEQSIYRITEEALNNANRHTQAKQIDVVLQRNEDGLMLIITDDGCGFDPDTVSSDGHYGLVGMRERATLCNGELVVESKPDAGTIIKLIIGV